MNTGQDSSSDIEDNDPYKILGIEPGSSFDAVQNAKEKRLLEIGKDPLEKAKVEAAYDSLLMVSLKARQLGNTSKEALMASDKEGGGKEVLGKEVGVSLLTKLQNLGDSFNQDSNKGFLPDINLSSGQGLVIRASLGALAIILCLIASNESIEIVLSLSTIGLFVSQIFRGRKPLPSIGWSILLLTIGLIIGVLLFGNGSVETNIVNSFSGERLEALPAIILLWLGSLFLA